MMWIHLEQPLNLMGNLKVSSNSDISRGPLVLPVYLRMDPQAVTCAVPVQQSAVPRGFVAG